MLGHNVWQQMWHTGRTTQGSRELTMISLDELKDDYPLLIANGWACCGMEPLSNPSNKGNLTCQRTASVLFVGLWTPSTIECLFAPGWLPQGLSGQTLWMMRRTCRCHYLFDCCPPKIHFLVSFAMEWQNRKTWWTSSPMYQAPQSYTFSPMDHAFIHGYHYTPGPRSQWLMQLLIDASYGAYVGDKFNLATWPNYGPSLMHWNGLRRELEQSQYGVTTRMPPLDFKDYF